MKTSKKLLFGVCDIFGGGSFNIINFVFPTFLALTVALNPFYCSAIMLIARIWDAVTDPIMGRISDRTSSRFGKRRIYLIIGAPLILITFFLMFFPYTFSSEGLRFFMVLMGYIAFCTVQTMVMIPYYALSSEISSDYKIRADANVFRLGFSLLSSIICVALPSIIVGMFEGGTGYIVMSLIFGTIFGLSVLLTGLGTREEISAPPLKAKLTFADIVKPFKLKSFRAYFVMFLTLQMTMTIMSGLFFFYVNFYYIKDMTLAETGNMIASIGAGLMFLVQIVALPFYSYIIKKKSKTAAYRFGAVIWIVMALVVFFLPANGSPAVLYLVAALIGFGVSGPGLAPHTMFGDIADEAELVFGERIEGSMSGIVNFINKLAQAGGLSLAMVVLGIFSFVSADNPSVKVLSQTDSAMTALRMILCFTPLILLSIGIFASARYKIDINRHKEIADKLKLKKGGVNEKA